MGSKRGNVDRLSCLHEEILSHILSLLPTKLAVRTSILSKRWRYHWTLIYNLDFDDIHPYLGLPFLPNFVDRVLGLCKTSRINLFRLHFTEIWVPKSSLSKWINEAIGLNVQELDIQAILLELPLSMFTCKTLTKLKVKLPSGAYEKKLLEFPCNIQLPCLKTLDISVFTKPSVTAFRLIRGCPVLESLSMEVTWPQDNEEYNFNIPTLKQLELRTMKHVIVNKVVLNLPNLEYFTLHRLGMLRSLFVMEDLFSLVEATVSIDTGKFGHLEAELLKGISRAKILSWSTTDFEVPLNSPLPKFPNLKHLELRALCSSGWMSIFRFLENSSGLEHLCIEKPEEDTLNIKQKVEESCWIEPQSVPSCMVSNLRTMQIKRFKGHKCDIGFIEYMLGNAEVLKTLTITFESLPLKEENRLCAHLLKFPRASRSSVIHFVGNQVHLTT